MRSLRIAAIVFGASTIIVAAVACGGSDGDAGDDGGDPAPGIESAERSLDEDRIVIDVRTPAEFDEGHIEDAELLDVQAPDFAERIAALDPEAEYVVYCRTGNRSATATSQMTAEGLDVRDGGSLGDMESAGWQRAE